MNALIYESIANKNLTAEDISNILETAQDFNEKNNITGCLVYHNHKFLQIIEGEKMIIDDLFVIITNDKRHSEVKLLDECVIYERSFKKLSMAYIDTTPSSNNEPERKMFISNMIAYAGIVKRPDQVSQLFWEKVKSILK